MSDDELVSPFRPAIVAGLVAAIAVTMFGAGAAWYEFAQTLDVEQPLTITACDPETYDRPVGTADGPLQSECDPVAGTGDEPLPASEPIVVAGQTCNHSDEPVAYDVSVGWRSVDTPGLSVNVIDVPITYEPGCQPAYEFGFEFPVDLIAPSSPDGESLGRWRIVGRADPVDSARYAPYQWDAVKTVEIVND